MEHTKTKYPSYECTHMCHVIRGIGECECPQMSLKSLQVFVLCCFQEMQSLILLNKMAFEPV